MKQGVVYLEGRPIAHPMHRRFAEAVTEYIDFIDVRMQWQDLGRSYLYNLICWFVNAKYLSSKYKSQDIFLIDNLHFTPVIMNMLFARPRKKLVVHLGSHTLYFIREKKFSRLNSWLHKQALQRYDALICEGQMAREIVTELLGEKAPKTYVTFLGPPSERVKALQSIKYANFSKVILIIANGPSDFRLFYKGLDVMIKAFGLAANQIADIKLKILGAWNEDTIAKLLTGLEEHISSRISFEGSVTSIEDYLAEAGLCLHCSRGDAFPTSTIEAMTAGVPVIVSESTGTKEVLELVDSRLISSLDENQIADKIIWFFELSEHEKLMLSAACKREAENFTEEKAKEHYVKTFNNICKKLTLSKK